MAVIRNSTVMITADSRKDENIYYTRARREPNLLANNYRYEQMSLSIRWVDSSFAIHEDVLALIQLSDTKAVTILLRLKISS